MSTDYPVASPEIWSGIGKLPLHRKLFVALRSRWYARARTPGGVTLTRVSSAESPLDPSGIVLLCGTRNAETQIPSFLQHYRKLGVQRFAFVDDRSQDDSWAVLQAQMR